MHGIEDELATLLHHPLIPYFQNYLSALTALEHCSCLEVNTGGHYEGQNKQHGYTQHGAPNSRDEPLCEARLPAHTDPQIETRTKWNNNLPLHQHLYSQTAFHTRVACSRPGTAGAKQPELKTGQHRFCVAIWLNLTPQHAFGLTCTLAQRRHLKMCLFPPKTSRSGSCRACAYMQMEQSWFTMSRI